MNEVVVRILSQNDIFFAQSESERVLIELGFSAVDRTKVKTIVSELAYNIIKYAEKGTIRVGEYSDRGRVGVLIESKDNGPGIDDIDEALTDNFSSSGTLGLGLPGIKRMADRMTIDSEINKGTCVKVVYWKI